MKKPNIISTLLLILISMSIHAQGNFKINPNGEKDLAAVNEYMIAVQSKDPLQIENIHATDVVGYGPRWNSPRTRQQIVDSFNYIWGSLSEFRYERVRMLPVTVLGDEISEYNGNWVMVWSVFVGKEKTTGKEFMLDIHEALKIDKGKVIGKLTYYNELDTMIQTGQYTGD
ncbi:MAG: nuclear transport factor 2 family protein [Algoriphagus aquaeductus]|uniref:nuclear transport factor 2 family protein n=1 Tax=Algoriphagus aquaeductus TaxID=475299 RepID=UPI00391BCAF6